MSLQGHPLGQCWMKGGGPATAGHLQQMFIPKEPGGGQICNVQNTSTFCQFSFNPFEFILLLFLLRRDSPFLLRPRFQVTWSRKVGREGFPVKCCAKATRSTRNVTFRSSVNLTHTYL